GDDGSDTAFVFAPISNGAPVVGDWNGDGIDTIGVASDSTGGSRTFYLRDSNDAGPADHTSVFDDAFVGQMATVAVAGGWGPDPPPYAWQTGDDPQHPCLDPSRVASIVAAGASEEMPHLHSVLVACHDRLVAEAYYRGYDATMGHNVKSVSKSILSALYGAAM